MEYLVDMGFNPQDDLDNHTAHMVDGSGWVDARELRDNEEHPAPHVRIFNDESRVLRYEMVEKED